MLAHPGAGRRLLLRDGVRLRQGPASLGVRRQHTVYRPAQIDRCRPGVCEIVRRGGHIGAGGRGEGHSVPSGDSEQRRAAHSKALYRRDEPGHVTAHKCDFLVRKPGLAEQRDRRPRGRFDPAQHIHAAILPHSPSALA